MTRAEQLNGEYVVHFHLGSFDILTSAGGGQRNMNIAPLTLIKKSYYNHSYVYIKVASKSSIFIPFLSLLRSVIVLRLNFRLGKY